MKNPEKSGGSKPDANFIEVSVQASEGLRIARAGDGSVLELAEDASPGVRLLMVRPEHIDIISADQAPIREPGWNALRGYVREQLPLGEHYDYTVEVAGAPLRVVSPARVTDPDVLIRFRTDDCAIVCDAGGDAG